MNEQSTINISMRPRTFDEFIGSENEVNAIRAKLNQSVPRAICLNGPFGCGKTTLAYLIAQEINDGKASIQEVNAAAVTGIDAMRDLIQNSQTYPFTGKYRVIILDEAHKLSKPAQEALLKEFESEQSCVVWIICTTDRDKLVEGLRAGRLFSISLKGMGKEDRTKLITRAAFELDHENFSDFLEAANKADVTSPRKILMAFEAYHAGIPAEDAVGSMQFAALPEYWEICMGVVFGKWNVAYTLPWIKGKSFPSVAQQIKTLDEKLKKLKTEDVSEEDVKGRPEVASALLAITAGTLKGQVLKGKAQAADALFILAHCTGPFGTEFATVIGGLYRACAKMGGA